MTNYHSQLVNHPHPGVVCCDTNSSSKLSHRECDICKGLGYVLGMQGAVFIPRACDASPLMSIKNGGTLPHRIEATFRTKGSGLVITTSHYHLFALAFLCRLRANKHRKMIAFTSTKVHSIPHPPSLYFGKMSAWRLLLARR